MVRHMPIAADVADPLSFAVSRRDADVLGMVGAALGRGDVLLAYQPVIDAASGRVAFHEGTVRVLDETGRVIPAAQFMGAVEADALGREIDCAALDCGLGSLARNPALRLSVNMSARSIGYPRWAATLDRWLRRDPSLSDRLILEISEASAMQVPELVKTFMADWQDKGVTFALDDFGAGATSFRHLKEFYFDIVKIDGSFVHGCDEDVDNQCILGALIAIGQQFDMFTVASRVERAAEADFLAGIGVDCLQGHYYGAPATRPDWLATTGARLS